MSEKKLYLDCSSGISGDMAVAALLDLGADEEVLRRSLASLPVSGFTVEISRVKKSGLDACDFNVKLDSEHENHDHDMEYLYGHTHEYEHGHHAYSRHDHTHDTNHPHGGENEHSHSHGGEHDHGHAHRGLKEILGIIRGSGITEDAKKTAEDIFIILADAEAKAHGVTRDEVHFHEVGAVDSIVDIVAAAVCLDSLGTKDVIASPLAEGHGTVRCQHGIIPVPVPAVVNIAEAHHLTIQNAGIFGELITPTGAAIIAAAAVQQPLPEKYRILATGLGAGKRTYDNAGVVRAMMLEEVK